MRLERSGRIGVILARIADLRKRAHTETDPVSKAELRGLESNWQAVLDSYTLVQDGKRFLNGMRGRRSAVALKLSQNEPVISQVEGPAAAKGHRLRCCWRSLSAWLLNTLTAKLARRSICPMHWNKGCITSSECRMNTRGASMDLQ
jgi:hypothetical protein